MADTNKNVQLTLTIKEAGAKETAQEVGKIQSSIVTLQSQLGKISRADQIQKLGTEMGAFARKTKDADKAVEELNKKLAALGASQDEIRDAAGAFSAAQNPSTQGGNVLQRYGAMGRNLPSVQIPGAGIGTDAISNLTRLAGALGEASGAAAAITSITTTLTPALGATAAGFLGVTAVIGPIVAVLGVLGLALKSIGDQAAAESKAINAIVDANRDIAQQIAEGLTTDEASTKLDELNAKRKAEADLLAKNQQVYDENINSAGALQGVLKLTSGAEEALSGQIATSTENITKYDTEIAALTKATQDGSLAANDAAEAEKKLAEERTKAVLSAADAAGKELAAQQKALAATEEQNTKRLTAIEDEKAVVQAQIDSLTESGDTSEEVKAKIEALNASLGALSKESAFITDTALAVSKQRDAEKKAAKDAEDAAKKAQQAQEQYTKAVDGARKAYKQSVQDIGTRLRQTLADNTQKLNRDLTDIATKYRRDEYDLELKANRAERDALQDQMNDLEDIRRDANKEEQDAIREGDFKALFLAREKNKETLEQETVQINQASQRRAQDLQDAREDLLRNAQRQRQDRLLGYDRQNMDARTSQQRDLQQAALTRQRALQIAAEGQAASLAGLSNYWTQFGKIQQAGMANALKVMQGGATGTGPNQSTSPYAGGFSGPFTTAVRK